MQASALSDPFPLATYALSAAFARSKSNLNHVSTSHVSTARKPEGWVTITSQGDGIHIIDLSNSQPLGSHTLGPSTTFAAPAISLVSEQDGQEHRTTYAVIESSPDIKSQENGRTVWMWSEKISDSMSASPPQRAAAILHHKIQALHSIPTWMNIAAISPNNILSVVSSTFTVLSTRQPAHPTEVLLKSWIFQRKQCAFTSGSGISPVIVRVVRRPASRIILMVDGSNAEGNTSTVGEASIDYDLNDIIEWALDPSGIISFLTSSGKWLAFRISRATPSDGSQAISITPLDNTPIQLRSLSLANPSSVSLVPLNSSLVLLASTTIAHPPELVLHIWDLNYSVLLASYSTNLPSTVLTDGSADVRINLICATSTQAVLTLSPSSSPSKSKSKIQSPEKPKNKKSTVLVVPLTVPSTSTIANAMGRASASAKWLVPEQGTSSSVASDEDNVLKKMQEDMDQGNLQSLHDGFFRSVEPSGGDETMGEGTIPKVKIGKRKAETSYNPKLTYNFASRVLNIVLAGSSGSVDEVAKIVAYILGHRGATNRMVESEGGLVRRLSDRRDWPLLMQALTTVPDVPEDELARLVKIAAEDESAQTEAAISWIAERKRGRRQRHPKAVDPDAMDVDLPPTLSSSDAAPKLSPLLAAFITYPTSPSALRLAIRTHLTPNAAQVVLVLQVLLRWTDLWSQFGLIHNVKSKEGASEKAGSQVFKVADLRDGALPPLNNILIFTQAVLDTSFLSLLQYTPSHRVLQQLFALIKPELEWLLDMGRLSGILDPFVAAQKQGTKPKSGATATTKPQKKEEAKPAVRVANTSATVGSYQLEELVW